VMQKTHIVTLIGEFSKINKEFILKLFSVTGYHRLM
jgi:hypothetical protein